MEEIANPTDFLGINYYSRSVVKADSTDLHPFGEAVRVEGSEHTAMDWEVYPEGLSEILMRIRRDDAPTVLYVRENGAAFADTVTSDGAIDDRRQAYFDAHPAQAARMIAGGAPL